MGINKTRDQELSSFQIQFLEFSIVSNRLQECFFRYRRTGRVSLDSLDETVIGNVDECVGDRVVVALVDGGYERATDEERHLIIQDAAMSVGQR